MRGAGSGVWSKEWSMAYRVRGTSTGAGKLRGPKGRARARCRCPGVWLVRVQVQVLVLRAGVENGACLD